MRHHVLAVLLLALFVGLPRPADAAIKSEGKYSGIVIFNRWGGCMLYRGLDITYVDPSVVEPLRTHGGDEVAVDATEVWQPVNPGPAVIRELAVLPPRTTDGRPSELAGIELLVLPSFDGQNQAVFVVRVRNRAKHPFTLDFANLSPTVLRPAEDWAAAFLEVPAVAVVSNVALWRDDGRTGTTGTRSGVTYAWRATLPEPVSRRKTVAPGEHCDVQIHFDLPPGKYEFLAGYLGGSDARGVIASNAVGFDIDANGTPTLANAQAP